MRDAKGLDINSISSPFVNFDVFHMEIRFSLQSVRKAAFTLNIRTLYFGKLVEMASAENLYENPMHSNTKLMLAAIPLPDPIYERS